MGVSGCVNTSLLFLSFLYHIFANIYTVTVMVKMRAEVALLLTVLTVCHSAFLQEPLEEQHSVNLQGSVDGEINAGRFLIVTVRKTTTTTSTSTDTLSTISLCFVAYDTATKCQASGRRKRSPLQNQRVIRDEPQESEEIVTRLARNAPADVAVSNIIPMDKGRFLVPSVSSTTTTVTETTTSTTYTATVRLTALSCDATFVIPLSQCY